MAATSLLDLPADVLVLCIDRSSYVDVRNAIRVCRAFRDAVSDMGALIADCRDARARAVSDAANALAVALAYCPDDRRFDLCDGALLVHVDATYVVTSRPWGRRVVWFELAPPLRQPPLLWSDADVVKPLIAEHASAAPGAVDRIWSDILAVADQRDDSTVVMFAGDGVRLSRVGRRWQHVSSKLCTCDVTPSLLLYLIALAVEVCCPPAARLPYLRSLGAAGVS